MLSIPVKKIDKVLLNKKYFAFFCILKGIRNGAVYGAKVRFPHSLVNTLLFRSGSIKQHATTVYTATLSHATSLALFVGAYKSIYLFLNKFVILDGGLMHFCAAFGAGFGVFGQDKKIHEQINLYLLSRVVYALIKLLASKDIIPSLHRPLAFRLFAGIVWGAGVWLFDQHQDFLQNSLASSMHYLYRDSERWSGLYDFIVGL